MEVKNNIEVKRETIHDIEQGGCFKHGKEFYIMTDEADEFGLGNRIAVNLSTGRMRSFTRDIPVKSVNASVSIT